MKNTPPRRSRRLRVFGVACLLLLLACVVLGLWSQQSDYRTLGQHSEGVAALAFAKDGTTLYSGCRDFKNADQAGKAWAIQSGRELRNFPGGAGVTLSTDGRLVATINLATAEIDIWETDTRTKRASLRDLPINPWRISLSNDGKILALAGCNLKQDAQFATDYEPGEIGLWDLTTGTKLRAFGRWEKMVSGLSFSPDDKTLASSSWDGPVQLWDVATGSESAALPLSQEEGSVSHITYSHDGHYLAAVGHGEIFVWDAKTRERTANLPDEGYGQSPCLSFSPDGRYLAAGGAYMQGYYLFRGCRVVVWNVGTWQIHREVKGRIDPSADLVWRLAFSPDSSRLALGSAQGYVGLVEVGQ